MFVWNEPELKELRSRTAHEKSWRRWSAILLAFFTICAGGVAGSILGVVVAEYASGGHLIHLGQLASLEVGAAHLAGAVILTSIVIPIAVFMWINVMKRTSLVSEDMVKRILRYGPY